MIILGGSEVLQKSRWCEKGTTFLVCHTVNFRWYDRCGSSTLWLKILTYLPTNASTLKSWNGNYSMQHCISSLMQSPEKGCAESKSETIAGHTYHRQLIVHWPLAIPHPPDVRSSHPPSSDICNSSLKSGRKSAILGSSTVYLLSKAKNNLCEYFRMTAKVILFPLLAHFVRYYM